jgi:hypothetical protein
LVSVTQAFLKEPRDFQLNNSSPEDQSILEEAFKRDPKPGEFSTTSAWPTLSCPTLTKPSDKSARLELVQQVSLGEKEVQVRFPRPLAATEPG